MDKRGIVIFVLITLAASFAVEGLVVFRPELAMITYVLLAIPAIAAWIASKASARPDLPKPALLNVPKGAAIRIGLMIPVLFALLFLATTIIGFTRPDWRVSELMATLPSAQELQLPPPMQATYPFIILGITFVVSIGLGPTLYALGFLGHEYGWRGYLLPRLMPIGREPAYLVAGLLGSLCYVPFFAYFSGVNFFVMVAIGTGMLIVLSRLLGEIWRLTHHVALTAVALGTFVCQATTVWFALFPSATTRFPWAGAFSVGAVIGWAIVAAFPEAIFGRFRKPIEPAAP
jgi:uncharacterized protein